MKWIDFVLIKEGEKTNIWAVRPKDGGPDIGVIKWFSRWRKYGFFPDPETVYEQDCLRDLADFVEQKTREHRKKI